MSGGGVLFCLIPDFDKLAFMLLKDFNNLPQLGPTKAFVPAQLHPAKPEHGLRPALPDMHMRRLVGLRAIKANSVAFDP
jgi:hypothetical protein